MFNLYQYPIPVSERFQKLIAGILSEKNTSSATIIFRDPDYSVESGGFHPVELRVLEGKIQYITDFSYFGTIPYAELEKELDFDFSNKTFYQLGKAYPSKKASGIFPVWQNNFLAYHEMGVYKVEVTGAS